MAALLSGAVAACSRSPAASPPSAASTPNRAPLPSPSPTPSAPVVSGVSPAQTTPQATLAGFLDANAATQYSAACVYVIPAQQGSCPTFLEQATLSFTPPVTIGNAYVVGNMAIVVAVGNLCVNNTCFENTNPKTGLPTNDAGFPAAYQNAVSHFTTGDPATPAVKLGANWYIDLGLK